MLKEQGGGQQPGASSAEPVLRVLIVEDTRADYVLLCNALRQVNNALYVVEWVCDYNHAMEALQRHAHDVALVDYRIPGGSTLDLLREAITIDWRGPVIVLTGLGDPKVDQAVMKLGAYGFLSKWDLKADLLERSIRYAVEKKQAEIAAHQTNAELLRYVARLRAAKDQIESQQRQILSLTRHLAMARGSHQFESAAAENLPSDGAGTGTDGMLAACSFREDGGIIQANEAMRALWELDGATLPPDVFIHDLISEDSVSRLEDLKARVAERSEATAELQLVGRETGKLTWVVVSLTHGMGQDPPTYFASMVNVTSRREAEEFVLYCALYDSLTGLRNRASFEEALRHELAVARRNSTLFAVMCMDLDGFKLINDLHGHAAGDAALAEVARRIRVTIRESDVGARLGGDEFAIIATEVHESESVSILANRLVEAMKPPFAYREQQIELAASVGIAIYPTDGDDADVLLERADKALYQAKSHSGRRWCFFDQGMGERAAQRTIVSEEFRRALRNDDLDLHFQPIFVVKTRQVSAVEALLRWNRADGRTLTAGEFVPLAESCGALSFVGEWALRYACSKFAAWRGDRRDISLVFNIWPTELLGAGFPTLCERALRESGLEPADLRLDIAARPGLTEQPAVRRRIEELRSLGIFLGLDGFTGAEATLASLGAMALQQLKLGPAVLDEAAESPWARDFAYALADFARGIGLSLGAKCVETQEQMDLVRQLSCDEMQGQFLSPPLVDDRFTPAHIWPTHTMPRDAKRREAG